MATTSSSTTRGGQQRQSRRSTARQPAAANTRGAAGEQRSRPSGPSIQVPYVTAQLRTRRIELPALPGGQQLTSAVESVRANMPSREQALFYGGLAASAAFSLIEWPVAVAIGVGGALVQRMARQQAEPAGSGKSA